MTGFYGVHQQHCDSQRSWLATNEKSFDHVLLPFETCTHTFLTYVCKVINLVSGLQWTYMLKRDEESAALYMFEPHREVKEDNNATSSILYSAQVFMAYTSYFFSFLHLEEYIHEVRDVNYAFR